MNSDNYITICGWMVTRLGLSGNDLIVYALIYGFSQDENSVFSGTSKYVAAWCNIRKEAALKILKRLTDKGLIEKRSKVVNGVLLCDYVATPQKDTPVRKEMGGGAKTAPGGAIIAPGGGAKSAPHIYNIDNTGDIDKDNQDKLDSLSTCDKRTKDTKSPYGEFGKVMLTDDEYERALQKYDNDVDKFEFAINILDTYIAQDKKRERRYTSHYAVLAPKSSWVRREVDERYVPRRHVESADFDDRVIKVF